MKESAADIKPISGTEGIFTINLFEKNGTCHIQMTSSTMWRPRQSQLILCEGKVDPSNYADMIWWQPIMCSNPASDLVMGDAIWDTGKPWGTNYTAAIIARDMREHYQVVTSTGVTE